MATRKPKTTGDVVPPPDVKLEEKKPATNDARPRRTRAHTPTRTREKTTAAKKKLMLAAFAKTGTVLQACNKAGVGRRTHYEWLDEDPAYAAQFEDAGQAFADLLEDEMLRRAVEGNKRPIVYKGKVIGAIREFSDVLLAMALKAARPEKYRDKFDINLSKLGDDELKAIAREKGIYIDQRGAQRALGPAPPATEGSDTGTKPN